MTRLTDEEQKKLEGVPKGTWALLLVFAGLLVAGWLIMYFGIFLSHGPVN